KDISLLNQTLRKNPEPWTPLHTREVQKIKAMVKDLPILYLSNDAAYKIVESDTSNIGWGGYIKTKKKDNEEQVI
ncbi:hypothetical protein NQ272_26935, partial [Escherichia coli]|nr:hypothetical protein [Escherichia coli]